MALTALLFRFGLLCAPVGVALAQPAQPAQQPPAASTAQPAQAQPSAPAAQGSALPFRSTLDGYQRFSDEKVGSWRDANDTVGRIGGWREYAKEARPSGGGSAPTPAAAPAGGGTAPASGAPSGAPAGGKDPHAGHGTK